MTRHSNSSAQFKAVTLSGSNADCTSMGAEATSVSALKGVQREVPPADRPTIPVPGANNPAKRPSLMALAKEVVDTVAGAARDFVQEVVEGDSAPSVDSEQALYARTYDKHGNPAYGRDVAFATVEEAREILGDEMIACSDAKANRLLSLADEDTLEVVPYTVEELKAMKGAYLLVAIPEMDRRSLAEWIDRNKLGGLINGHLTGPNTSVTTLGWYAVRKTRLPESMLGEVIPVVPSHIGAYELLYAAIAAKIALGKCPFRGHSAHSSWDVVEKLAGLIEVDSHYHAMVHIGRFGATII